MDGLNKNIEKEEIRVSEPRIFTYHLVTILPFFRQLYSGSSLSYELEKAQPASRFAFRFCARNSAGSGPWSPIATCLTPPARPGQPCGLRATRVDTDAIHLLWFRPLPNGSPVTSKFIHHIHLRLNWWFTVNWKRRCSSDLLAGCEIAIYVLVCLVIGMTSVYR